MRAHLELRLCSRERRVWLEVKEVHHQEDRDHHHRMEDKVHLQVKDVEALHQDSQEDHHQATQITEVLHQDKVAAAHLAIQEVKCVAHHQDTQVLADHREAKAEAEVLHQTTCLETTLATHWAEDDQI